MQLKFVNDLGRRYALSKGIKADAHFNNLSLFVNIWIVIQVMLLLLEY